MSLADSDGIQYQNYLGRCFSAADRCLYLYTVDTFLLVVDLALDLGLVQSVYDRVLTFGDID